MKKVWKLLGGMSLVISGIMAGKFMEKAKGGLEETVKEEPAAYQRLSCYYDVLTRWMENKQEKLNIGEYLLEQGISKVGIYGHGKIGLLLYNELKETDIVTEFFLENDLPEDYRSIDHVLVTSLKRGSKWAKTDAIIVTPVFDMNEIEKNIKKAGYKGKIISLSVLLYQM